MLPAGGTPAFVCHGGESPRQDGPVGCARRHYGGVIDHVILVLLMGAAAAGVLVMVLRVRLGSTMAVCAAVLWYLGCLVPILLARAGRLPDPLGLGGAVDFAHTAALVLGPAAVVAAAGGMQRAEPRPFAPWPTTGIIALVTLGCACWLVALEGQLSPYTWPMVVNCILMAAVGALTALGLAMLRRRARPVAALGGVLAGLGAASAVAASVPLAGAGVTAVVAALLISMRSPGGDTLARALRCAGIGSLIGLLAAGLLDLHAGFFFSGQPTLAIAQVTLAGIAVATSVAVGLVARGAAKALHGSR